jgi:phospholipase C
LRADRTDPVTELSKVQTIVVLMFENRSFDHMLGHLSYDAAAGETSIDGLQEPLINPKYLNTYAGDAYYPFSMPDAPFASDLPHEREFVTTQLDWSDLKKQFLMDGFVEAYDRFTTATRTVQPYPMGFLPASSVWATSFLATNFAVCDRWFAPIPTSTQPNRLMLLTARSAIDATKGLFPPLPGRFVLDWLGDNKVRWRVYHCGISFFALLGKFELVLSDQFQSIDRLAADVANESEATFPQVIFIEPSYADAPHIGSDLPNDNHPPLAVGPGERLLTQVYEALTSNPERWASTLFIVTYDEHGGFYDHVPPLQVPHSEPNNPYPPFTSTGPRVPGLVISPLVASRTVYSSPLDHTSVLQVLAERFTPGTEYSPDVTVRKQAGIGSVSAVLNLDTPRVAIPTIPAPTVPAMIVLPTGAAAQPTKMQQAFADAATTMVTQYPQQTAQRYPELVHWQLATKASAPSPATLVTAATSVTPAASATPTTSTPPAKSRSTPSRRKSRKT